MAKGLPPPKNTRKIANGGKTPVALAAARRLEKVKNGDGVDQQLAQRPIGPAYENPKKVGFLPGQYHN